MSQSPARRRLLSVLLSVALADVTIYRGAGFAGLALLMVVAPALLFLGSPRPALGASAWLVGGMLLLLAGRLFWLGSPLAVGAGFVLLVALSLALAGQSPHVPRVVLGALGTLFAGYQGLRHYQEAAHDRKPTLPSVFWPNVILPLAAITLFGSLFILANPDLVTSFNTLARRFSRHVADWLVGMRWWEIWFWITAGWVSVGLLRPIVTWSSVAPPASQSDSSATDPALPCVQARLYVALRNTLVSVNALFAVYLVFEFQSLWFREFPPGFYYAGYAHEGAFWLTVALALATLVLSLIFRGQVLRDSRLGRLRKLAWLWSALNLVLALTVYNRMYIYIDFNGMTRMRTIGLFGITTVLVGFCLVLWKIIHNRGFGWLLQRQLWALAIAIYIFALTPVDWLVHSYNVRRVLAGDLAPAVQMSVHPVNAEGILVLRRLVDCDDPIIREGIRALLAQRVLAAESLATQRDQLGWSSWQLSDNVLLARLRADRTIWAEYQDAQNQGIALKRFHDYVYQWY